MSTANTIFSILSFTGFFLVCITLPWRFKAWNVGTCIYSIWTALSILTYGINAIIWKDDAINRAPLWCDITTRITVGTWFAIPAATLCINRRLYNITTLQTITWSRAQSRRMIMIDLSIGVGVPLSAMILFYIVQLYRFVIFQEIGCYPSVWHTPLTLLLINSPPVALSLISASYAIRSVIIRRRTEEELKKNLFSTSELNANIWYRLLALASVEVFIVLPLAVFGIIEDVAFYPPRRWISWENSHSHTSQVVAYQSIAWRTSPRDMVGYELARWSPIFCAFFFFALFGLTEQARGRYKMALDFFMKCIRCSSPGKETSSPRLKTLNTPFRFTGSRRESDSNISISSGGGTDNHSGGNL